MLGSGSLETAIGLIFIYIVLGFVCTSANEFIAQLLGLRAENLYESIHGLFSGDDKHRFAEDILSHAQIQSVAIKQVSLNLSKMGEDIGSLATLPATIPPTAFSTAVMDLLGVKEPAGSATAVSLEGIIDAAPYDNKTLEVLRPLVDSANDNLDQARKNIEAWFDNAMQQASAWYKRKAQVLTLLVACAVVFVTNADTIVITDQLWKSPAEQSQLAGLARNAKDATDISEAAKNTTMGLLGWSNNPKDPRYFDSSVLHDWVQKAFGLLITVFAVSLGAPFWFDKLSLIMSIRSGGKSISPTDQNRIDSSDKVQVTSP